MAHIRFDAVMNLKLPSKHLAKIDKDAAALSLSRSDYVRLMLVLMTNSVEIKALYKPKTARKGIS